MKHYIYTLTERHGEYECPTVYVTALPDHTKIEDAAQEIAMENRSSSMEDYDEDMEAFWFDSSVTLVPDLEEIPKSDFDVLSRYL